MGAQAGGEGEKDRVERKVGGRRRSGWQRFIYLGESPPASCERSTYQIVSRSYSKVSTPARDWVQSNKSGCDRSRRGHVN